MSVGRATLSKRGGVALVVALVVNVSILTIVREADLVTVFDPLEYPPVVLFTTLGVIGATLVYAILDRRVDAPDATFVRVAIAVLVFSWIPDGALLALDDDATLEAVVVLGLLHVPPAVSSIAFLTDRRPDFME